MASDVLQWLLSQDVSIKWQAMRDIEGAPEAEYDIERAKVETEGWGKDIISHQDADGQWAGGSFLPSDVTQEEFRTAQPWCSTAFVLSELRLMGVKTDSEWARRTTQLVGENCRWDEAGQRYWDGETEECINGRTVSDGAYFGADVSGIVKRLLGQLQVDGGWNCERANGDKKSSFDTTISVLEGLLDFEKCHGPSADLQAARKSGEEYLLERKLFRRKTDGEVVKEAYTKLVFPWRWRYNVLRGLDYFRQVSEYTGEKPDPRLGEAIQLVRNKRQGDGKWLLDDDFKGRRWIEQVEVGQPSPWVTLIALRVLKWWDQKQSE